MRLDFAREVDLGLTGSTIDLEIEPLEKSDMPLVRADDASNSPAALGDFETAMLRWVNLEIDLTRIGATVFGPAKRRVHVQLYRTTRDPILIPAPLANFWH